MKNWEKYRYLKKKERHRPNLPPILKRDEPIVDALNREAIYLTTLDTLAIPGTSAMMSKARELLQDAIAGNSHTHQITVPSNTINQYPEILLWGAYEPLLNLIENYIELPIYYLGAELKREIANDVTEGIRCWHLDKEDHQILKLIIYLNEVNESGGPFQYISRPLSHTTAKALGYASGLISDEEMGQYIPKEYWISVTGDRSSCILVDTCRVFHRAKPPENKDRYSITFHYTSQFPFMSYEKNLFAQSSAIRGQLSPRQLQCVRQS